MSQLVQLHLEPGGEEAALVALELRPQGPAMGVGGFKVVRNRCEQGRSSRHPQLPSQISVLAHFPSAVKEGASGDMGVQYLT